MKTVCAKDQCAGCMACVDICPKGAIEIADGLYAWNAVIDESKCVECGLCHGVCGQNEKRPLIAPVKWYQGFAAEENIRRRGSSGGVATALALAFVKSRGAVCSCTFENGAFSFRIAENEADVLKFSGSKYVKSNPQGCFHKLKALLKEGKRVLFIGLPCQSAAVQNYVGEKYRENLYTVDLICHGTPSPMLLEQFLRETGHNLSSLGDIRFRDKSRFRLSVDKKPVMTTGMQDLYTLAFIDGLFYTENCYSCRYATEHRVSDITLGDSWGSELEMSVQEKGLSLILCQTEKGIALIENSDLTLLPVDLKAAVAGNDQLQHPSEKKPCRERFFKGIAAGQRFHTMMARCYPKQYCKLRVKHLLRRFLRKKT